MTGLALEPEAINWVNYIVNGNVIFILYSVQSTVQYSNQIKIFPRFRVNFSLLSLLCTALSILITLGPPRILFRPLALPGSTTGVLPESDRPNPSRLGTMDPENSNSVWISLQGSGKWSFRRT